MSNNRTNWLELRNEVRDSRRQFASNAVRVPTNFSFRKCLVGSKGQPVTRIYFLAAAQVGRENTLLYVDVPDEGGGDEVQLTWNSLIEASFQPGSVTAKVSKEEQLMLERKRLSWSWGITAYDFDAKNGKFVFPSAGTLYGCYDNTKGISSTSQNNSVINSIPTTCLVPHELRTSTTGARLNSSICPTNSDLVAFVCNGDIWVHNKSTEQEVRLTFCDTGEHSCPVSAGLPAYIMQEEFKRFTGFWWRPKEEDGFYTILYEEVDESDVELIKFPTSFTGDVEEFRFPKAGTANAQSSLKIVRFSLGSGQEICNVQHLELDFPLTSVFTWLEYIVRIGWTPNGKNVWVQLLDRRQQLLQLVLLPLQHFVRRSAGNRIGLEINGEGSLLPTYHVIYTEKSDTWINVTDILEFLPSEDENIIKFVWASEVTGFRHLYLIKARLHSASPEMALEDFSEHFLRPHILNKISLTSGDWTVIDKPLRINVISGFVYFHGLKDTPLEKHLYVVSLHEPGVVRRLTQPGFSHNVFVDSACSVFVTMFSSIASLPACQVFRITHSDTSVDDVIAVPAGWILGPTALDKSYQHPEVFSHVISSGDELHAMVFKPHQMKPGVKYPVLLNIYGGPEVQLVSNTFKGMRQMRSHLLASQGYCVVSIDSRGSHYRGVAFESHLRLKLGQLELADQVEFLAWLASFNDYLDMDRVAIHGWSYGGYLSLMALVQYPELFKVAIAGAPVTDWTLYDTAYTERYMDLPENNPSGYTLGSVLNYGNDFPDEPNRLLIVHGLMDENVHFFQHTTQLISLLIRCGKPYQLQIYPNERHSLRHLDASEHFETMLLAFLKSNL